MSTDLWRQGAAQLAEAIRERIVSSRDVVAAHLARIAAVNPVVNAVVDVRAEEALAAADAADRALARGDVVGHLHGVPVTIKANIDVAGAATTSGMAAFAGRIAAADAPVVARLRAAGAVVIGRTNMPDLGLRWHTASSLYGETRNPWNAALTPGGSSGGEAAALATGMTPLGIGNDVGGSVRWPAQCCGVASIRPTLGRLPLHAATSPIELPIAFRMFLTDGPMARHVRDLRLALEVAAGTSPLDPWSVPATATAGRAARRTLRIAVTTNPGGCRAAPPVAAGVQRAADVLAAGGYAVEAADPPALHEAHDLWGTLLAAETRTIVRPLAEGLLPADALQVIDGLAGAFPAVDLPGYVEGLARRTHVAREWNRFFEDYDVLLGPVACDPPFPVGHDLTPAGLAGILGGMQLVTAVNLLGLPAAVVPVGIADGLPQAVQLVSARFDEAAALAVAEQLETRCGVVTPVDPSPA